MNLDIEGMKSATREIGREGFQHFQTAVLADWTDLSKQTLDAHLCGMRLGVQLGAEYMAITMLRRSFARWAEEDVEELSRLILEP